MKRTLAVTLGLGMIIFYGSFYTFQVLDSIEPIPLVYAAPPEEPVEVLLQTKEDYEKEYWGKKENIIREIRDIFPEDPNTAVAIAICENPHLIPDQQSNHILSYGREQSFGIFQIHAPDWHETAVENGWDKYQNNVLDNLAMARHIYDVYGWTAWTCSRLI